MHHFVFVFLYLFFFPSEQRTDKRLLRGVKIALFIDRDLLLSSQKYAFRTVYP